MRINVGFGLDQTKKEEEDDDEEILEEDIFAALNDPQNRLSKKANVLDTVARNAIEHQKRVKLRVEQMINTKQEADNFVKEAKMKQKKRLDLERMAQGQRDYVSENK